MAEKKLEWYELPPVPLELSPEEAQKFAELVRNPPPPSPALIAAVKRHRERRAK